MYNTLSKTIMIISFLGLLLGIWLISKDIKNPGFCPRFFFIPDCYIISISFFLVYTSTYFIKRKTSNILFFIGNGLGLILSSWFSYVQINGLQEYPKLFDYPLCYILFFIFFFLLLFQLINNIKIKK